MDSARKKIMLVDDNITNLTAGRHFLKPFYDVYTASSAALMFEILEKKPARSDFAGHRHAADGRPRSDKNTQENQAFLQYSGHFSYGAER